MDYKIVIPSSGRSETVKFKTIAYLNKHNIPLTKVYVFVSEKEIETYRESFGKSLINIVVGEEGLKENRMAIADYFCENEKLVSIDDDLTKLITKDNKEIPNLDLFIKDCFNILEGCNMNLLSIYPSKNPFFFNDTLSTDLKFCCGAFRVFFLKKLCEKRTYNLLEDYETTINYYKYDGGVCRRNDIGMVIAYNRLKGGLTGKRTIEDKKKEVQKFIKQLPNYAKEKKDGTEIQLTRFPAMEEVFTLWVGDTLPYLQQISIQSWIRQGYRVKLYTNTKKILQNTLLLPFAYYITIVDASKILAKEPSWAVLPYSDLFRYKVLYEFGGTWLDADLILLKQLPTKDTIISSEYTMKSGAFKSKNDITTTIQCLRFVKGNPLIKKIIDTIHAKIFNPAWRENMKVFRKIIEKELPLTCVFIEEPASFCPVPWWNIGDILLNTKSKVKYNCPTHEAGWILRNSIGLHLFSSILNKKKEVVFNEITEGSLLFKIIKLL